MGRGIDYIPGPDREFLEWARNFVAEAQANAQSWTFIATEITDLNMMVTIFKTALDKTSSGECTHADVVAKNDARKEAEHKFREFYTTRVKYNKTISNAGRAALRVTIPDQTRTPAHRIDEAPEVWTELKERAEVHIHYKRRGETGRAKHPDAEGIGIKWAILDHAPQSRTELTNYAFDTDGVCILGPFDEGDRGKRIYLDGAWEIHKDGIAGPPSEIVEAIIP